MRHDLHEVRHTCEPIALVSYLSLIRPDLSSELWSLRSSGVRGSFKSFLIHCKVSDVDSAGLLKFRKALRVGQLLANFYAIMVFPRYRVGD